MREMGGRDEETAEGEDGRKTGRGVWEEVGKR